ncbi:MAG TPA: thioredoxin [Acidimicrobiia bacterium]|nr:thioredoxin [Acidimicrobiia bacterium]
MSANTVILDEANFDETIGGSKPILVDFWAEWCGPCRLIAPILEEIAVEHGAKLSIGKLNVDEHPQLSMNFDVMSIPTLILFKDGVEKKRIVGARPKHSLVAELGEYLQ